MRIALIVVLLSLLIPGFNATSVSRSVFVATTTSVRDTGLLRDLLPNVPAIAVGSGKALQMGMRKEADLVISHYPKLEHQFMADGFGIQRRPFMYNRFVIVGPFDDPAGISNTRTLSEAFKAVADNHARFISRGDGSGTNAREIAIWAKAHASPFSSRYISTGSGMGATLATAESLSGYTLTDESTFNILHPNLRLFRFDDDMSLNLYSALLVSEFARDTFNHVTSVDVTNIIQQRGFVPCRYGTVIVSGSDKRTDSRTVCPDVSQQ
jgi:tungstate transport system substrate-binding protein